MVFSGEVNGLNPSERPMANCHLSTRRIVGIWIASRREHFCTRPPPPVPLQRNQPTREAVDPGVASYSVCQNLSDVPLLLWWFHFLVYIQSEKAQNTPFQKMELHPSGFPIFWFQNLPRDDRLVLLPTFFQCSSWLLPSVVPSGGGWFGLEWGQPETREYPFSFMNKIQDKI